MLDDETIERLKPLVEYYRDRDGRMYSAYAIANIIAEVLEPPTIEINGYKLNPPERVAPPMGKVIFYPDKSAENMCCEKIWGGHKYQLRLLQRNQIYLKAEDAIAHADAELSPTRLKEDRVWVTSKHY